MKSSRVVGEDRSCGRQRFAFCFHILAWMLLGAVLMAPALKAHAVIGRKGKQPPFKEAGANPLMAHKLLTAYQARLHGATPAPPMVGDQPIVFILIENQANGAPFDGTLRDPKLWQARIAEMRRYWDEVSVGRLQVTPAKETEGTANDGVIGPITVPEMTAINYENNYAAELMVVDSAIRLANQYIDFAALDKNNDGKITGDELHIIIVFAGLESSSYTGIGNPPAPSQWGHLNPLPNGIPGLVVGDADGKLLTSYLAVGSKLYGYNPSAMAPLGLLCHEMGHDLGLPDLYDTDYFGTGGIWNALGVHSLMSSGNWNTLPGGIDGSMPAHLDGWCKSMLGWANETVLQAPTQGTYMLPAAEGSNAVVRINIPNSQEYFVVENRQHILYDRGIPGTLGGLLILHCDDAVINGIMGQNNMLNANPLDPGIKVEEASGRNRLLLDLFYQGGDDDYYRVGNNATFNEMTNPNSNKKDGLPSSVEIYEVSPTGPTMTFKLGSGTPRIGFASPALRVNEASPRIDCIVNLSKKAANLAMVDYVITGGTATGGGVDYTLGNGTLAFYPGETSKYFTVQINNDSLVELNETVNLALTNVRGAMLDNLTSTTVLTIVDNDNPFLNLIKPNGGERIALGTRFPVTWKSDVNVAGNTVVLQLYKDGNFFMPLTGAIPNSPNGSYNVLFPASLPVGFNYKLAVTSVSNPQVSDQSDAPFALIDSALKITVLSINGGAATTTKRQVTLNNWCGGKPTAYMASESPTFSGTLWKPYSQAPLFVLSPGNGTKRVYFKTKNSAGQEAATVSDTIVLQETLTKPVIQQFPDTPVPEHQLYTGPAPTLLAGTLPVVWSVVDGPTGIKINPGTGVISWADPSSEQSPCQVTIRAANNAGSSDMSWTLLVEHSEPALGVDCPQLAWDYYGDAPWFTQRLVTHDGVDAARSKPIGNNQKAVLTTTVTGPGVFSFWWKVSSELNYDKLGFYLDDNLVQSISGEVGWTQKSISVPVGQHSITWIYAKDAVGAAGADAGYVDQVSWAPGLTVSGISRAGYSAQPLTQLTRPYQDRLTYFTGALPELFNGQVMIQTRDADRRTTTANLFSFTVNQPVTVVLAIDARFAVQPAWAANYQLLQTRLVTNEGSRKLYALRYPAGRITLGGNCNPGPRLNDYRMYNVILIPNTPVAVTNLTNPAYSALTVHAGVRVYADATSTFADPVHPLFWDQSFIRTRNSDRNSALNNFLSFDVSRPVAVILALDSRIAAPPSWASGWQLMADQIRANDHVKKLYVKRFQPGRITLGGNLNPGQTTTANMYSVLVMSSN